MACAAAILSLPAVAGAATVTGTRVLVEDAPRYGGPIYELMVRYDDRQGEANDVTATSAANQVTIED